MRTLSGHTATVMGLALLDPGGGLLGAPPLLASVSSDTFARLWDLDAAACALWTLQSS